MHALESRAGRPATRIRAVLVLMLLAAGTAAPHAGAATSLPPADAAWQSPLYTRNVSDLIATDDEVWAATREGGLLHLDRATGALARVVRQPGGLASNELTSLALDRSGRLWVGTVAAGVSRLRADRSGWDLVNRIDGLPADSVLTLTAVGDTVWIGTTHGLALWNGREVTGSLPDPNTVSFDTTFRRLAITGIVQMGDSLWLATRGGVGLAHLSAGLTDWRPVNAGTFDGRLDIEDLAWDGRQLVMVGQDYAHYFQFATGEWALLGTLGVPNSVTGRSGELWLGTSTGVHRWTGAGYESPLDSPVPFPQTPTYLRAVRTPDGVLYAGTGPYLYEYRAATGWKRWDVPGPVDNALVGVAFDRGRVYLSSFGGMSRWDGAAWRRWFPGGCGTGCDTTFRNPAFSVGLFADSRGVKWVGSWSIALDRFTDDTSPPAFVHLANPQAPGDTATRRTWTYSGAEDAAGRVWLGMDTADDVAYQPIGVTIYAPDGTWLGAWSTVNSTMAGEFVWALERDKFGRMWLGYKARGLDWVTPNAAGAATPVNAADFRHLESSGNSTVHAIAAYGESLWVLAESGLQHYRLQSGTGGATLLRTLGYIPGPPSLAVHPLAVAADGSVWVATAEGVWHVGGGADSTHYTEANSPLASNTVRSIGVEPGTGAVWIATAAGVQRFDPGYVPPAPPPQTAFTIRPYPNPATTTNGGVRLRLNGAPAGTLGVIHDIGGRRVGTFRIVNPSDVFWDGRDDAGHLVKPGVYLVRAAAGDREAFARVVLLH